MPTAVLVYNCIHCRLVQESALADIAAVPAPLNHPRSGLQICHPHVHDIWGGGVSFIGSRDLLHCVCTTQK